LNGDTDWGAPGSLTVDIAIDKVLELSASQISGHTVQGLGGITITGFTPDVDLDDVSVSGTMSAVISSGVVLAPTASLGSFEVTVDNQAELTLSAAQAHGATISVDDGSVVVTALHQTDDADLSLITLGAGGGAIRAQSGGNVTFAGNLGVAELEIASGTFTANLDIVSGAMISGAGTLAVEVVGGETLASDLDAAMLDVLGGVSVTGGVILKVVGEIDLSNIVLPMAITAIEVSAGAVLTLATAQSDYTFKGAGTVRFYDTGTFVGDVDPQATLTLLATAGTTLSLTADKASGHTVGGEDGDGGPGGSVIVTGLDGAEPYDLDAVTAGVGGTATAEVDLTAADVSLHAASSLGTLALSLEGIAGTTGVPVFTLSAAQATGRLIADVDNVDVRITGAAVGTAYDFSDLNVYDAALTFTGPGAVDAATDFGPSIDTITLGGATTLSAAQANGISFAGTGAVTITGSAGDQVLSGTAGDDTIAGGTAEDGDQVDITQDGNDTLVFDADSFMLVSGFETGSGKDVLDFSSLGLDGSSTLAVVTSGAELSAALTADAKVIAYLIGSAADPASSATADGLASSINTALELMGSLFAWGSTKAFLATASANNSTAWLWSDDNSSGNVQASELTALARLNDVDRADLLANELDSSNFAVI
jgi:hypothetical protein